MLVVHIYAIVFLYLHINQYVHAQICLCIAKTHLFPTFKYHIYGKNSKHLLEKPIEHGGSIPPTMTSNGVRTNGADPFPKASEFFEFTDQEIVGNGTWHVTQRCVYLCPFKLSLVLEGMILVMTG